MNRVIPFLLFIAQLYIYFRPILIFF